MIAPQKHRSAPGRAFIKTTHAGIGRMIWKPLIAATLALWLSVVTAGTALVSTTPSIPHADGLTRVEGRLKAMSLQPERLRLPVSRQGR
jgi:hypothetical protein